MATSISSIEIITALVAVYGAALSTIIFIKDQNKHKRKVTIKLSNGFLTSDRGLSDPMLIFEIANPGQKSVTLVGPKITLPDNKSMFFPEIGSIVRFPATLEEGKSIQAWIKISDLKAELVRCGYKGTIKLNYSIDDQTGKTYNGKKSLNFPVTK